MDYFKDHGNCMNNLTVLSLGAGVQSSTLALMSAQGMIRKPDFAIFSDTQAEPMVVYSWLEWLKKELPFPVHTVTAGNISELSLHVGMRQDGRKWIKGSIPAFVVGKNGNGSPLMRTCTSDYKVRPIRKFLNSVRANKPVTLWLGISIDEVYRMKPSKDAWCKNVWPLIDLRMSRNDCLRWMKTHGYPDPPRSACIFCPYHSNQEWRKLRDKQPDDFQRAIEYERKRHKIEAEVLGRKSYLHRSLVQLDRVDLSTENERGQLSMFVNECEGLCGV